ncbi:proline dehydrogenase family protein [Methanomassiliicoccus luminyensis]|uniref:proline dehydrogenase family protein n=1 Tax=Methanomassiliicoccus luminyensis TaxID=1080712 RepID=UPI0009DB06CC|nr:proline dehydrogenase family protein [Methanomassiliicoccus luminyensis]
MEDRWVLPDQAAAIEWCRQRNEQSIRCAMDVLAKYSRTDASIDEEVLRIEELAAAIRREKLNASVVVKLSALGGTLNREICIEKSRLICEKMRDLGVSFELDMEGQRMVNLTLEVAEECVRIAPVTVALQAYLRRTHADLIRMLDAGVKVRLVKGAYLGDIREFDLIAEVLKDLVEEIVDRNTPFSMATHDPDVIKWAKARAKDKGLIEFGFLKGLADQTKVSLAAEGWVVSEYVPFGKDKEGYESRRRAYLKTLDDLGRSPAP